MILPDGRNVSDEEHKEMCDNFDKCRMGPHLTTLEKGPVVCTCDKPCIMQGQVWKTTPDGTEYTMCKGCK